MSVSVFNCPYTMSYVPFARPSGMPGLPHNQPKRNIICGGTDMANATSFYEIILSRATNPTANFISIEHEYMKINANLNKSGSRLTRSCDMKSLHSHLTSNEKYVIAIQDTWGYNVYDLENDNWLLSLNNTTVMQDALPRATERSLLINDEIIAISEGNNIHFYSIAGDRLKNPQLIAKHNIKTDKLGYACHGMCCIGFDDVKQGKDNSFDSYTCKIVLFGGAFGYGQKLFQSFVVFNIKVNRSRYKIKLDSINEEKINFDMDNSKSNREKWVNIDPNNDVYNNYFDFGFECIYNAKQEAVILIIGGMDMLCTMGNGDHSNCDKCVITCNLVTKKVVRMANVS